MTRHIREQFPEQKHRIDLLLAEDPEFFTLCEDYDACVDALQFWMKSQEPEAKARVDDYRTLVRELQEEIIQVLKAPEPRRFE